MIENRILVTDTEEYCREDHIILNFPTVIPGREYRKQSGRMSFHGYKSVVSSTAIGICAVTSGKILIFYVMSMRKIAFYKAPTISNYVLL